MATYPLEFHRRSEQKWVRRAQAASARESIRRAALVGSSQGGQRRTGQSERRGMLAEMPWLRETGNGSGPGTMPSTNLSRNVSPRS
jgi:hypothetical protein